MDWNIDSNCLGSKHNDHAQDAYGGGYGDLLVLIYILASIASHDNYVNHGFTDLTQKINVINVLHTRLAFSPVLV